MAAGLKNRKDVVNPFMLQYFFTSINREDEHLNFLMTLLSKIKELAADKGYIDKRVLRQEIIDKAAAEAGVKSSYDKSKVANDLLRLGVVIGGEVRDNKFYSAEISLAFNARYLALSHAGIVVLETTSRNDKLRTLAESYASNYIVSRILLKYSELYRGGTVRVDRRSNQEVYRVLVKPAIDVLRKAAEELRERNPRLAEDLDILADMFEKSDDMRKKYVRSVLLPLSLLTLNEAAKVTRVAVELNIDGIRKLISVKEAEKVTLEAIVNAYCSLVRSAGFSTVGSVGPEVPVVALAKVLGVEFNKLNEALQELSKYEKGIIYEIAVGLRKDDPNRFVIRVESSLIRKICKDFKI